MMPAVMPAVRATQPPRRPRFRPAAGALLIVCAAPCLGACGDARASRRDNTLVAAVGSDPGHLNPAITTNGSVHTAAALLYNGLLGLDEEDLTPRPELAERWEVEDGGRRYRFHLRRDVRWHDGRPFTAADVAFTFDSLLLRFHARTRASLAPALLRVEAADDSTVVFHFRRPYAPLLQQLDVNEAPIAPRHVFAGADPLRHPANTQSTSPASSAMTCVPGSGITRITTASSAGAPPKYSRFAA